MQTCPLTESVQPEGISRNETRVFMCVLKLSKSQTDSVMFRGIRGMKQAVRLHIPRISTESERCKCLRLAVAELTGAFMPISKSKMIGLNIFPGSLKFLCPALMPAATAKFCRFFWRAPKPQPLRSFPRHHWATGPRTNLATSDFNSTNQLQWHRDSFKGE